jgi:excinuclease ABC subunit A
MLSSAAPQGQFLWNNQQVVHLFLPAQKEPWATLHTKRTQALELALTGPKSRFGLGRVANLGQDRELNTADRASDVLKLKFTSPDDLHRGDLAAFLREHCSALNGGA